MTEFMLVHGGWHGAWCWERVVPLLATDADVHAPSLAGLADRAHLMSPEIGLSTHVDEIVGMIEAGDMRDVVLMGHSYGGAVITGVADRVPERLSSIIYLDAFMPSAGESVLGLTAGWVDDGKDAMAVPPAGFFGLSGADADWVQANMTEHPALCIREKADLVRERPADEVPTKVYVLATGWDGVPHFADCFRQVKDDPAWVAIETSGSHDLMVDQPELVARVLLDHR